MTFGTSLVHLIVCGIWNRWSWGSLVIIVTRLLAGSIVIRLMKVVFFSKGSTQPPIKWAQGAPSQELHGRGVKLTNQLHLDPRQRLHGTAPPVPLCVHGVHRESIILLETKNYSTVLIKFNFMLKTTERKEFLTTIKSLPPTQKWSYPVLVTSRRLRVLFLIRERVLSLVSSSVTVTEFRTTQTKLTDPILSPQPN